MKPPVLVSFLYIAGLNVTPKGGFFVFNLSASENFPFMFRVHDV